MAASIGGVDVTRASGGVKWGLLGAILVGGPLYAYFQGLISVVRLVGGGITSAVTGIGEFVAALTGGVFSGIADAMGAAWWSFFREATFAGPLTFAFVVAVTTATLAIVAWGVSRVR